jgi:hypothetical protein
MKKSTTSKKAAAAEPTLREFLRAHAVQCERRVGDANLRRLVSEITVDVPVSDAILAAARAEGSARAELLDQAIGHVREAQRLLDQDDAGAPHAAMNLLLAAERTYGAVIGNFTTEHPSTGEYAKATAARKKANARHERSNHTRSTVLSEWGDGKGMARYGCRSRAAFARKMADRYGVIPRTVEQWIREAEKSGR